MCLANLISVIWYQFVDYQELTVVPVNFLLFSFWNDTYIVKNIFLTELGKLTNELSIESTPQTNYAGRYIYDSDEEEDGNGDSMGQAQASQLQGLQYLEDKNVTLKTLDRYPLVQKVS